MSDFVTSATLIEQVDLVREAFEQAAEWRKQADIDFLKAKRAYKKAYNEALVLFRKKGSAVEIAKAEAELASLEQLVAMDQFSADKVQARIAADFCTETMRAMSAISYVVNNETKMANFG